MKHKVSELEGALLDAAVAKAEGVQVEWVPDGEGGKVVLGCGFSTSWVQAGPIIDRERIGVDPINETGSWCAYVVTGPGDDMVLGATPLIAAMRAYVASKFGDEVELP